MKLRGMEAELRSNTAKKEQLEADIALCSIKLVRDHLLHMCHLSGVAHYQATSAVGGVLGSLLPMCYE